jgi:hypothetical protein
MNQLVLRENAVIVPGVTEERLKQMPEYRENEVRILESGVILSDEL